MSTASGSTSLKPDLDWSQLKETILMLNLSVAQIDQSMSEGNASVDTLVNSFTTLATKLNHIDALAKELSSETIEHTQKSIQESTNTALSQVQSAIIAFQFYDKLTQRIDHVSESLSSLSQLISDPNSLYSPPKWHELQTNIRSKYTMEEEREMFDKVLSGTPIEQAISEFNAEITKKTDAVEDNIELF